MAINNAAVLTTDTEILTVPASKKYAITRKNYSRGKR